MKDHTAKPRLQINVAGDKWEEIVQKYFWYCSDIVPLVNYKTDILQLQESSSWTWTSSYNLYATLMPIKMAIRW